MEYRENAHSWCAHGYMPYIVIFDEWKVYVLRFFFNDPNIQGTRARPEYQILFINIRLKSSQFVVGVSFCMIPILPLQKNK